MGTTVNIDEMLMILRSERQKLIPITRTEAITVYEEIASLRANVDYLLTMLGNIEQESSDPNINAIIKAARQGVT